MDQPAPSSPDQPGRKRRRRRRRRGRGGAPGAPRPEGQAQGPSQNQSSRLHGRAATEGSDQPQGGNPNQGSDTRSSGERPAFRGRQGGHPQGGGPRQRPDFQQGGPGGGRRRKRNRKRRGGSRFPVEIPRDDLLYRRPQQPLSPHRKEDLRRRFQLENLVKYAKPEKTGEDFKTVFEKMEFLEYEVAKKIPAKPCPICQKEIDDYYATIHFENTEVLAHISCVSAELAKKNELAAGESIHYLGNGAFGIFKTRDNGEILTHPVPKNPDGKFDRTQTDPKLRSGLELVKKIQYENRKLSMRQQRTQIKN